MWNNNSKMSTKNQEAASDPGSSNSNQVATSDPGNSNGNQEAASDPGSSNGNQEATSDPGSSNGNQEATSDPGSSNGNLAKKIFWVGCARTESIEIVVLKVFSATMGMALNLKTKKHGESCMESK